MNNDQKMNNTSQSGLASLPGTTDNSDGNRDQDLDSSSGLDQTYFQQDFSTIPPEANEVDLIEKEWVTHLKYIISQTSEDPYVQQAEISKAKADYMRKRYDKDIKISQG